MTEFWCSFSRYILRRYRRLRKFIYRQILLMSETRKKMVIIGDGACGKTCLSVVFMKNIFPEYKPTMLDRYSANIEIEHDIFELELWDAAGQEEYYRLRQLAYPSADVILLCFSVDSPSSLENILETWMPEIKRYCKKVPIVLIANKKDLRYDSNTIKELSKSWQEPIKSSEGQAMADKIKAFAYLECSAINNDGVKEIFETAVKASMEKKKSTRSCGCPVS